MAYELFTKFEVPDDGFRSTKDEIAIFEYRIEYMDDGTLEMKTDCIVGYSDNHALEEAWYECSTQVYAVTRACFLYWQ